MALKTGKQYIDGIDQLQANIWIDGNRITGKISEHPAFAGLMHSQAKLYDLQNDSSMTEIMSFADPDCHERIGTSFMQPKSKDDLAKRRHMIQAWAVRSGGMLGRSPDYMNTVLMTFGTAAPLFAAQDPTCEENMRNYYHYASKNDLSLTHTFVNPQVNRSQYYTESKDQIIAAQMIGRGKDGITIHGARMLATQGGSTDEIMVFPSLPTAMDCLLDADNPFAYAFAIPNNTPGLKFICRESFNYGKSAYDHPLGSRFEEMDTIVVFDHVKVPWERVFVCGNGSMILDLYHDSGFFAHVGHQVVAKNVVKTEFILGLVQLIAETIKITEYQHVQEKIAEVIVALETMKSYLIASEAEAKHDQWGTMTPDLAPLQAAMIYYPRIYPRFTEILQLLGASGLMTIPSKADFESELRSELDRYIRGADINAYDRVHYFRLAWDVCMSAFGTRQLLYERFFFGDPVRQASNLYHGYDKEMYVERVKEFLAEADLHSC